MDLFNHWKDQLQNHEGSKTWNMHNHKQSLQHLQEIKNMMKEYRTVIDEEFWGGVNGLRKQKPIGLPVELWESKKHVYLLILAPGLKSIKQAKIEFKSSKLLEFKVESHSIKPEKDLLLVYSELPVDKYEREIQLSSPIIIGKYSSSFENGIITYTFFKDKSEHTAQTKQINIPFNF